MYFNVEDFDYEAELRKIKDAVRKPNILITGATGAGKSSLVNHLFGENVAPVGEGRPVTEKVQIYSSPNSNVNLYDSKGYEVGGQGGGEEAEWEEASYRADLATFIEELREDEPEGHIHEVWHCVSAAGKRFTDMDAGIIQLAREKSIPVAIVFTQIDGVDEGELAALVKEAEERCEGVPHFAACAVGDAEVRERVKNYVQTEQLLEWAAGNLDDALREGFVSSLAGAIDAKRDMIIDKIIPMYAAMAGGIGAIPIPFSDMFALIPLQVKMSMHIMSVYGLNDTTGIASRAMESFAAAQVGKFVARTLASNLLKLIPVAGALVGGAVNAGIAASFTYGIGKAVCKMGYNYTYDTVITGAKIPIHEAFSSAALLNGLF